MEDDDREVVIVGLAFWTVRGSQGLAAPLLLESPVYTALKLKLPVEPKLSPDETGTTPLVTVTVDSKVPGALHAPFVNTL